MDSIVKKLSEIEAAASAIVNHAEKRKETLDREFRDKRAKFDSELEAKTSAEIKTIRNELKKKTEELLAKTGDNCDAITALEREYELHHTEYAQNILKRITEV